MAVDTTKVTTVQVRIETWQQLQALKQKPGDSVDDVISRLLEAREREQVPAG